MTQTRKPQRKRKSRRDAEDDDDDVFAKLGEDDEPAGPAFDAEGWPTVVPVLTADDMSWDGSSSSGRNDLGWWLTLTFNTNYKRLVSVPYDTAYAALCEVITERFKRPVTVIVTFVEFMSKHRMPCKAWQAACWNEMLIRLGYDIPKAKARDPGFKPLEDK